jgi:hypothetical protein
MLMLLDFNRDGKLVNRFHAAAVHRLLHGQVRLFPHLFMTHLPQDADLVFLIHNGQRLRWQQDCRLTVNQTGQDQRGPTANHQD